MNQDQDQHSQGGPDEEQPQPQPQNTCGVGDNLVAACPEMSRVEQRLEQIREYISVTATLVDTMKNSEDQLRKRLHAIRSCNDILTEENNGDETEEGEPLNANEVDSDLAELMETLANLKDSEKKLEAMLSTTAALQQLKEKDVVNVENGRVSREDLMREADHILTEIHSIDGKDAAESESQDEESTSSVASADTVKNNALSSSSESARDISNNFDDQSNPGMGMLQELQKKRQQIENQVEKIQNLSLATSSLASAISANRDTRVVTNDNNGEISDDGLKRGYNKMEIMKAELQGLKQMLHNVDSIQNSICRNSYTDAQNQNNHNQITNHTNRRGSVTNDIAADLVTIQEISQQLKMDAEAIKNEKMRLRQASGKDVANSSNKELQSNSGKSSSKSGLVKSLSAEPGPIEKKQLLLKAELEAKKRELEFLMGKRVNHNTNQVVLDEDSTSDDYNKMQAKNPVLPTNAQRNPEPGILNDQLRDADNGYSSEECEDDLQYSKANHMEVNTNVSDNLKRFMTSPKDDNFFNSTQSLDGSFTSRSEKRSNNLSSYMDTPSTSGKQYNRDIKISSRSPQNLNYRLHSVQDMNKFTKDVPSINIAGPSNQNITSKISQAKKHKKGNTSLSNNSLNNGSSSSSIEDHDLTGIPPPMATLPPRRGLTKNNGDNSQTDNTQCEESQITMWWHNKATQLQQQLEMTNNLCQNLLQDRNNSQPGAGNSANGLMLPNPMFPFNMNNSMMDMSWFSIVQQQQQLSLQQQQLSAMSLGNTQCMQQLLAQQREIFSLRNTLTSLEDKFQNMNVRAHSTPPTLPVDSFPNVQPGRVNSSLSHNQGNSGNWQQAGNNDSSQWMPYPMRSNPQYKPYAPKITQNDQPLTNYGYYLPGDQIPEPGNMLNNCHVPPPPPNVSMAPAPQLGMHPINCVTAGQSTALNNQVPPGNRANNYWDNFRSYSRQNLLSGNNKVNADGGISNHPHPLAERSHNPLRSSILVEPSQQITNTPKRNLNNTLGNALHGNLSHQNSNISIESSSGAISRTRRNLLQESIDNGIQPDVLNLNQNPDTNVESSFNRNENLVNINLNRPTTSYVPEIVTNHSNVNISNSVKKKSSIKLPAKNSPISSNYANPASTDKLFDLLRENVYSEVSALITANESRPHFLIQLFRDLQHISSDDLRQRTLQSIQELSSHCNRNNLRESSANNIEASTSDRRGNTAWYVDTEIINFITAHHLNTCSSEFLHSLHAIIMSTLPDCQVNNEHVYHALSQYEGRNIAEISDEMISTVSKIYSGLQNKISVHKKTSAENPGPSRSRPEASSSKAVQQPEGNKIDLIQYIDSYNGDLAEADQSCQGSETTVNSVEGTANFESSLPDVVDTEEQTPTEAEAEWLGLDRVPTRLQVEENTENPSDTGGSSD